MGSPAAIADDRASGVAGVEPSRRKLAFNYALLSGGEAVAKIAAFLAFTYLGRTLGSARYGSVEFTVALIVFFSLPVSFGLEEYGARELARNPDARGALAVEISYLRLLLSLVSAAVLAVCLFFIPRAAEEKMLVAAWGLSLVLLPGLAQWFFQGHDEMGWVTVISIVRQSVFAILVLTSFDAARPLYQLGFYECAAVACAVAAGWYGLRRKLDFRFEPIRMDSRRLRQHLAAAMPIGLSHISWAFLWYSATVILGFASTRQQVGEFGVAHRITLSIHTFVWLYFVNLLPSISRAAADGATLRRLLNHSIRLSSWVGFFAALAGAIVCRGAVSLTFGDAFAGAAPVLALLLALIPLTLVHGHFRYTLIAANEQRWLMAWSLASAALTIALAVAWAPAHGAIGAAWALIAGGLAQMFLNYFSVRRHVIAIPFFGGWLVPAAAAGAAFVCYQSFPANPLAAAGAAFALYGAALVAAEHRALGAAMVQLRDWKASAA